MSSLTREEIEAAVRAAWARDTCDPVDVADWSAANPGRGQCGTTALTINDLLGGELLLAEVLRADGSRQGVHWWNRLPDGTEMDLTREQFASYEVIQQPRVVPRPSGLPKRAAEQYLTLRHRVLHALGLTEARDIRWPLLIRDGAPGAKPVGTGGCRVLPRDQATSNPIS